MKGTRGKAAWIAVGFVLHCAACGVQATSGYLGEPLMTLNGRVVSNGALPPLEAALLWQLGAPPSTDDQELSTLVPVETGFPATFTLNIYQPAPIAARRSLAAGEVVFARANAGAVPYGIAASQVANLAPSGNPRYGIDAFHWVIYLDGDVPQGSLTEWWLGAPLPPGFHVEDVTPFAAQCMTQEQLDACANELASRGVLDDGTSHSGTARSFCLAPYRLAPALPGEELALNLGEVGLGGGSGACP